VVVRLGQNAGSFSRQEYSRASIKGKPLPDLGECGLAADAAPAGKPLLIVLLDVEQRPSRRVAQALAEKQASLREKGINVVAVQIPGISAEAFKEWQDSARPAYPVSRIAEKTDKTKWVTGVGALPWLILADSQRRVAAEGFDLEDLDAKVSAVR
jgi:hypothetical protein